MPAEIDPCLVWRFSYNIYSHKTAVTNIHGISQEISMST